MILLSSELRAVIKAIESQGIEYDIELHYLSPPTVCPFRPGDQVPNGTIDGEGTKFEFVGSAFVVAINEEGSGFQRIAKVYARIYRERG